MKKALTWLGITIVMITASYFFSPKIFTHTCQSVTGDVSAIYADARKTLHVRLKGNVHNFLLPAGKLDATALSNQLMGKEVYIRYHNAKLALNAGTENEIASISINKRVLYSE